MTENQNKIAVWDFTLGANSVTSEKEVIDWLKTVAKAWTFQLEEGEKTSYLHYQGRFTLKVRDRLTGLKKKCPWNEMRFSITSAENKDNDYYVCKSDRLKGPWRDTDEEEAKANYMPRQVREIQEWYPWQKTANEIIEAWDPRGIHAIIDPRGNNGKSVLCAFLGVLRKVMLIPFCNDYRDIMRMVKDMPKVGAYFIDMPRALRKEKLYQFYGAIETVKSGYAYDDRYGFKYEYFDCPNIIVFTNTPPDESLLSRDRWKLWTINKKHELVPYKPKVKNPDTNDGESEDEQEDQEDEETEDSHH